MSRRLVSFDWAMKRLLRSKANFDILNGFLSVLLKQDVRVESVLESEGNKEHIQAKYNRVDLLVRDEQGQLVVIEVQFQRELDYLLRLLYGSSKVICEYMREGAGYEEIKKVISIGLVYFSLGQGLDYVYHGKTRFFGLHKHDELALDEKQRTLFCREQAGDLFPEYYLIRINEFDGVAKDPLDEWIFFFKHGEIKGEFKAPGLPEAREKLDMLLLSDEERRAYERYQDGLRLDQSMYRSSFVLGEDSGYQKGVAEGKAQGIEEGKAKGIELGQKLLKEELRKKLAAQGFNETQIDALLP